MCDTCGCGETTHKHTHNHDHHHHDHEAVSVNQKILAANDRLAGENRRFFQKNDIVCLNILSSPGSGKTTLLQNLLQRLKSDFKIGVIEGDQQTSLDAARIRQYIANVTQINTNRGCHLDAHMVGHALDELDLDGLDFLFVENVGNLICPSMFDIGEAKKIVVLSVTEGDDKPLKYPNAFYESQLAIISKIDLLPYVDFDVAKCADYMRRINPGIEIIQLSSKSGQGFAGLMDWLARQKKTAVSG